MNIVVLLTCLGVVAATPEYVTKKLCREVDAAQCSVQSVIVDPCAQGPAFCVVKKDKNYAVTLDMVPHFSASKLKLAVSADVDNQGTYSTIIKTPDACSVMYCPLQAEERRIFDLNLVLDKRASVGGSPDAVTEAYEKFELLTLGWPVTTEVEQTARERLHRGRAIRARPGTWRQGKFPVKVKLWDENDESKACCVSFNVKVK